MSADIVTLFPSATVRPLIPRSSFGLVRPEDRDAQERVKTLAREARAVHDRKLEPITLEEIIALTDELDDVARRARALSIKSGRAVFQIVAQDAESLSERLVFLAADIGRK